MLAEFIAHHGAHQINEALFLMCRWRRDGGELEIVVGGHVVPR
jgi:hypothetical protein